MRTRLTAALSAACAALLFSVASATTASAQGGATRVCKDGTKTTATGRGACSGHGGVDSTAAAAGTKSMTKAAKADAKADTKAAKTGTKAAKSDAKADTKMAKADTSKTAAKQVKCTDGTMSKGGRGACSGHGGVAKP